MADIVLKDRNGNPIEYPGVNHIKVKNTDGETKDFIARTPVETTVALDFSGGDMEVNPESEELFSKVNIPVPANLIPENIAEGVDIAGIVGALAASGGGGVCAGGSFTGAGAVQNITHGLGVNPDLIIVWTTDLPRTTTLNCVYAIGVSENFNSKLGISGHARFLQLNGTYYGASSSTLSVIEKTTGSSIASFINNANTETFNFGASWVASYVGNGLVYNWLAIGGLT